MHYGHNQSQSVDVLYCVRCILVTISGCIVLGALWPQSVDVLYCVRRIMVTISGCIVLCYLHYGHNQWMYCIVLGALWSQSVDVL